MTTSVDVLAVMALDANHAYHWRREGSDTSWAEEHSIQSEVARAAVAVLIEAAQRLHDRAEFESFGRDASAELDAVIAAIARVKGA
jgi:hypothetical protein